MFVPDDGWDVSQVSGRNIKKEHLKKKGFDNAVHRFSRALNIKKGRNQK